MKYKLFNILILIFGFISFSFGQTISFPKPIGFVNDFENILNQDDITKLETLLHNYEKQTSNELVIVTISKLKTKSILILTHLIYPKIGELVKEEKTMV